MTISRSKKAENRKQFNKENDYEVLAWNICLECKFFKSDLELPIYGECQLMAQNNCFEGVIATAICNRYVNKSRTM
jgi:hypothetical protein